MSYFDKLLLKNVEKNHISFRSLKMSPLNQKHCITYASVQVQFPHLKISTLNTKNEARRNEMHSKVTSNVRDSGV